MTEECTASGRLGYLIHDELTMRIDGFASSVELLPLCG